MEAKMFNKFKIIKRALVSIAAIAVLVAPATASARPIIDRGAPVQNERALPALASLEAGPSQGFRWDDAAIGAAGMLGLMGLAGAASQRVRRRRPAAPS
jgi:hypothetical protein